MIKAGDKLITAIWERDTGSELLISAMSGSGPACTQMFDLLRRLASIPNIDLPEGRSISFRGKIAIALAPASDEVRRFFVQSANHMLDEELSQDVRVTLIEWGEILVSHDIVHSDEIPPAEKAIVKI